MAPLYVGCPVRENLQALLVVGNPSPLWPIDAAANARLSSLGFQVTVVDDGASTSANADGKDVVLVSPSVDVNLLGTKFRDVAVPVVFSRGWAYPSMNMSVAHGNAYGGPYTQLNLVSNHPLAAGLSGTQTVLTSASPMGFGQPSAGGVSVASYPGQPTLWGIFGYEKDALMLNSQRAPERRVGFFLATTQNNLTPVGWQLFDAAVIWAARQ